MGKKRRTATVGVTEHGNSVVLVTLTSDLELIDRRTVDLTEGLPTHPHHHEGSWAVGRYKDNPWAKDITLTDALALVERVRVAAAQGAQACLADLADAIPVPIQWIAIRECPELPPTPEACIADNRVQSYADSVMYRQAVASAARDRGWSVGWYDRDRVFDQAAALLRESDGGSDDVKAWLKALGRTVGPPWQAKHKLAAAAALAVLQ